MSNELRSERARRCGDTQPGQSAACPSAADDGPTRIPQPFTALSEVRAALQLTSPKPSTMHARMRIRDCGRAPLQQVRRVRRSMPGMQRSTKGGRAVGLPPLPCACDPATPCGRRAGAPAPPQTTPSGPAWEATPWPPPPRDVDAASTHRGNPSQDRRRCPCQPNSKAIAVNIVRTTGIAKGGTQALSRLQGSRALRTPSDSLAKQGGHMPR